ncbi:MAG: alpha/beta hydrolase, partial [Limnobacter sp.]|nr:alpha/beta hydrolase [Limnobacter sp.]
MEKLDIFSAIRYIDGLFLPVLQCTELIRMAQTKAQTAERQPDPEWLDSQYNVRSYLSDFPKIFADWAEQSRYARFDLDGYWNLFFGESESETVDVIPGKPGKPLLIFIHGGFWRSLDKYDFTFLAKPYVARGYSVALLNHGLIPRVTIEDSVRQTLRGIEWLYRQADRFGYDKNQLIACGHSSGAHLAVMSALAFWPLWAEDLPQDLIKSVVAVSGVYDLSPLVHTPFIQQDLKLNQKRTRMVSPALMPKPTIPVHLAFGSQEKVAFQEQSAYLASHWALSPPLQVDADHYGIVNHLA